MGQQQWASGTVTYSGAELDSRIVSTSHFQQVIFTRPASRRGEATWVFIDGDGNSWLRNGRASEDPTPTDPLALRLLLQTPERGIYLARPCSFGARADPRCAPAVWTVDRYSEVVIASMQAALAAYLTDEPVVLVGYSGGGVLAVQLAERIEHAVGVITVAANLDIARWALRHGYTPELARRSAPLRFPLRRPLLQLHVFGGRDDNAPYALAADLLAADPRAQVKVFPAADHDCCWQELWPAIAAQFQQLMDASDITRASSSVLP